MAKIKGLCKNVEECSKAKNRELQARSKTDLFVCEECYEPLDKIIEKADDSKKYYMIGGGVLLIIILIGVGCILMKYSNTPKDENAKKKAPIEQEVLEETTDVVDDSETPIEDDILIEIENSAEEEDSAEEIVSETAVVTVSVRSKKAPKKPKTKKVIATKQDGVYDLGYATWSGKLNNGKPYGNAQMTFKRRRLIEPRDDKSRYAGAGDYIIGTYKDGHLIHGRWYKKNGNIETITIGEAASDEE